MKQVLTPLFSLLLLAVFTPLPCPAAEDSTGIERAKGERLATAIGHYARARSLLIAALREFDKGSTLANPSALLDDDKWRSGIITRAEDLERVLDPQPRKTRTGARYDADTRLLAEAE